MIISQESTEQLNHMYFEKYSFFQTKQNKKKTEREKKSTRSYQYTGKFAR